MTTVLSRPRSNRFAARPWVSLYVDWFPVFKIIYLKIQCVHELVDGLLFISLNIAEICMRSKLRLEIPRNPRDGNDLYHASRQRYDGVGGGRWGVYPRG